MLDVDPRDSHRLFQWLRKLSFVTSTPRGVCPHDLVRDVIVADLRWRDSQRYRSLVNRAREFFVSEFERTAVTPGSRETLDLYYDLAYLHRANDVAREFFDWSLRDGLYVDTWRPGDWDHVAAALEKHEGSGSVDVARYWLDRQPEAFSVVRDIDSNPTALLVLLQLTLDELDAAPHDPAVGAAFRYLDNHCPLRAGECALYTRYWLSLTAYQNVSPEQSMMWLQTVRRYVATPSLVYSFAPFSQPDFWAPIFSYQDFRRIEDADFECAGQHFGLFGRDFRMSPAMTWLELLSERQIRPDATPQLPAALIVVLDRDSFGDAVHDALRAIHRRPELLTDNPLVQSRLILERLDDDEPSEEAHQSVLRELIGEALEHLSANVKGERFADVVQNTYLQRSVSQERTAHRMGLPLSTYKRYLKRGVEGVADYLWRIETGELDHQVDFPA